MKSYLLGYKRREVRWKSTDILKEYTSSFFRAVLATYFHVGFLLVLFYDSKDGDDIFFRNLG
jgi:hypothetical protein